MINENNFLNKNEIKNDPPKKDYSDEEISEKLSKGVGLDKEFALYLLKENKKHALFENLDKFKDYNEMTIELIKDGKSYFIVERLNNIHYGDPNGFGLGKERKLSQEVALELIKKNVGAKCVAEHLFCFQGLNQELALKLIKAGYARNIPTSLDQFNGLSQEVRNGSIAWHHLRV